MLLLKDTFSPMSFVNSAASAGLGQWRDRPKEWKQGAEGYGLRYASSFAEHIANQTLLFGASSLFREDNRYVRSGEPGTGARVKYGVASTFMARHADGTRHISWSRIIAFAGAAAVSRLWQPHDNRSVRSGMFNFGTSVGITAGFNVAREFWPGK